MSRFTDLFQEPPATPEPLVEEPKVEEVVEKPVQVNNKPKKGKKSKFN